MGKTTKNTSLFWVSLLDLLWCQQILFWEMWEKSLESLPANLRRGIPGFQAVASPGKQEWMLEFRVPMW